MSDLQRCLKCNLPIYPPSLSPTPDIKPIQISVKKPTISLAKTVDIHMVDLTQEPIIQPHTCPISNIYPEDFIKDKIQEEDHKKEHLITASRVHTQWNEKRWQQIARGFTTSIVEATILHTYGTIAHTWFKHTDHMVYEVQTIITHLEKYLSDLFGDYYYLSPEMDYTPEEISNMTGLDITEPQDLWTVETLTERNVTTTFRHKYTKIYKFVRSLPITSIQVLDNPMTLIDKLHFWKERADWTRPYMDASLKLPPKDCQAPHYLKIPSHHSIPHGQALQDIILKDDLLTINLSPDDTDIATSLQVVTSRITPLYLQLRSEWLEDENPPIPGQGNGRFYQKHIHTYYTPSSTRCYEVQRNLPYEHIPFKVTTQTIRVPPIRREIVIPEPIVIQPEDTKSGEQDIQNQGHSSTDPDLNIFTSKRRSPQVKTTSSLVAAISKLGKRKAPSPPTPEGPTDSDIEVSYSRVKPIKIEPETSPSTTEDTPPAYLIPYQ